MLTTLKAGLAKIAGVVGGLFSSAVAAISGMGLAELIKIGLIAGVSIAVIVLIFKFLRDKWRMYTHRDNTVTEAAIGRNYADLREQDVLHPLMYEVKSSLRKDLKPRKKKGGKKKYNDDYLVRAYMNGPRSSFSDKDLEYFRAEIEKERINKQLVDFHEGYKNNFGRVHDPDMDSCSLRRIFPFGPCY